VILQAEDLGVDGLKEELAGLRERARGPGAMALSRRRGPAGKRLGCRHH
jgi:hypothetical protein